jgi:hypothetical protein
MKKKLFTIIILLFSSVIFAQGVYNNGGKIVIGAGAYFYISGTAGNYRNETGVSGGAMALDGTLKLDGNYTNNVAGSDILAATGAAGEVAFTGTTSQTLGGTTVTPFTFNNLTVNNSTGVIVTKNATVNGMLTLSSGLIDIGNNDFVFGPSATVAGVPSSSAMLLATGTGQVKKQYGAIGSFTFPVGDNTVTADYSPVTLNFTGGTFAPGAYAGINLVNAPYPDPYITGSYLNRYWNVSQTGITGFTCDAAFNYVTSDIVGTESNIYCVRITPLPIALYDPSNTILHQLTANGLTSFGTYTGALGIKNLSLKLFFEGLYNGGGTMREAWNATGPQFGPGIADVVSVDLHDAVTFATVHYTVNNIQVTTSGNAIVPIPPVYNGSYYISVHQRNSIETITSSTLNLSASSVNYDFTTSASQTFANNVKQMPDGKWALYGGDANEDGAIDALDLIGVENDAFYASTGYILTDVNGDGVVDAFDLILVENNAFYAISVITP